MTIKRILYDISQMASQKGINNRFHRFIVDHTIGSNPHQFLMNLQNSEAMSHLFENRRTTNRLENVHLPINNEQQNTMRHATIGKAKRYVNKVKV